MFGAFAVVRMNAPLSAVVHIIGIGMSRCILITHYITACPA